MKQLDLFENQDDEFIKEAENLLLEMELELEKLEEQEWFLKENKAFEWDKEFPQLCDADGNFEGFDLIVGNPPYIDIRNVESNLKSYYNIHYAKQKNSFDLYSLFIERGFSLLNKNGYISYIVPKPLLYNSTFSPIRKQIFSKEVIELKLYNNLVFKEANVENVVFIVNNAKPKNDKFILKNNDKSFFF